MKLKPPCSYQGGKNRLASKIVDIFKNIEEFAQYMADEYGWTSPDVRIFYIDGEVKEIFGRKME